MINDDEEASGFEVDSIIGDHTAVEVKAKEYVSPSDLKPLRMLQEEKRPFNVRFNTGMGLAVFHKIMDFFLQSQVEKRAQHAILQMVISKR